MLRLFIAIAAAVGVADSAAAQSYPDRLIKMVVPYPAGGPIDRTHVFATWAFWIGIQGNDIPLGASVSLFMVPILAVAAVFILRDIHRRASEMS